MWKRRLDDSLVEGWIERAVAVAPSSTPARVRALGANAYWHDDLSAARAAVAEADQLGDVELQFESLGPLMSALAENDQVGEALDVAAARTALLPEIADPDHLADALMNNADLYVNVGRLVDARGMAVRMEETVAGLTPHHRMHGLGMRLRLEYAAGAWEAVRALVDQAEDWVEPNLATPCPFNVGVLLMTAIGMVHGGDEAEASRLEAKADAIGMVGYGRMDSSWRLGLAVARGDLEEVRRVVDSVQPDWLYLTRWELWVALLDGLLLLGNRERIEADAPRWVRPDSYVAPFAVRALGVARGNRDLLADAIARFEGMGLGWHAAQTRRMANGLPA